MDKTMNKKRILFLCTGNSCRSQMAEGWANYLLSDNIEAYSAGVETHPLNMYAVKVMSEKGIDISNHKPKLVSSMLDIPFNLVVTVCDAASESCPIFPYQTTEIKHIPFPDPPALTKGFTNEEQILEVYRKVCNSIRDMVERL